MSVLQDIRSTWGLFRCLGIGFCSLHDTQDPRLAFTARNLLTVLVLNGVYLAVSWFFFLHVFLQYMTAEAQEGDLSDAKTYNAVSMITFFTDQFSLSLLLPLVLLKQRRFVQICNRIHELDLFMERNLKVPHDTAGELRVLRVFTVAALLYFVVSFAIYGVSSEEPLVERLFQVFALVRPLVMDCVNLQFISIVLLVRGRVRRVAQQVQRDESPEPQLLHQVLRRLGDCVALANEDFSLLFLLQTTRLIVTVDNDIYQLVVVFNSPLLEVSWTTLLFVGVVIAYSIAVYATLSWLCHHVTVALEELSVRCGGCRAPLEGQSELALHLLQLRSQRRGHGLGFTAFGIVDMDLRGQFSVRGPEESPAGRLMRMGLFQMFALSLMYVFIILQFDTLVG